MKAGTKQSARAVAIKALAVHKRRCYTSVHEAHVTVPCGELSMQAAVRRALVCARRYAAENHLLQGFKLVQACPSYVAHLAADGTVHDAVWVVRCVFKLQTTRKAEIVPWRRLLDVDPDETNWRLARSVVLATAPEP